LPFSFAIFWDRIDRSGNLEVEMFRTRHIEILGLVVLLVVFNFSVWAQDKQSRDQDEPIRLNSDLVTVTASASGPNATAVKTLKVDDFSIYEDGIKQKISHFSATEQPFSLLLLLDISGSTRDEISMMKRAARNFLGELRFDDRVAVLVFSRGNEIVADFSDARAAVATAIDNIGAIEGDDGHLFTAKTGTSFYDSLYMAVDDSPLKEVEGRKAIVCMSDGVDSTSKMRFSDIAPMAERSDASFYFLELNTEAATLQGLLKPKTDAGYINFSQSQIDRYFAEYDPDSPQRGRSRETLLPDMIRLINTGLYKVARRELRTLAERTGGRVFPVKTLDDLSGVYRQVGDELRSQYTLGYYPSNRSHDGRWRAIRVETRAPGISVRARSGYWAK
jgi:VWFA-related protein